MRNIFVFIVFLIISSYGNAQDLIISKSGKRTEGYITKEDSVKVYLTTRWNNNLVNTFINRNEIESIHYNYFQEKPHGRDSSLSRDIRDDYTRAFTIGILNGGGSLVGVDIEFALSKKIGLQFGCGFVGFGAGLNLHFKPSLRSSFISFQYWHQGIGESYSQSLLGPSIVLRARKIFTAQIGFGYALGKGPAWPEDMEQPPMMLTYSIGVYFPQ